MSSSRSRRVLKGVSDEHDLYSFSHGIKFCIPFIISHSVVCVAAATIKTHFEDLRFVIHPLAL